MSRGGIPWKPPLKILVGLLPMPVRVQDPYRIGVSCSLGRNISAYWTWVSYSLCLCPSGRKTPIRLGSPISWSHSPLLVPCASLAPLRQYSRFSFVHAARKNSSYLRMIENSNFFQLLIIFSTLNRISNCCKRFSCRNRRTPMGFIQATALRWMTVQIKVESLHAKHA